MTTFVVGTGSPAPLQPFTPDPAYDETAPRCVVILNASPYLPLEVEVVEKAHGSTDQATVTLDIGSNPDFSQELFRGVASGPLPIDTSNDPVPIQIYWGFPANTAAGSTDTTGLKLAFWGLVDIYSAAFHANMVTFNCRSLAAPLITDKLTRLSVSESSLQFAQQCATYAGLKLVTNLPNGYKPITVQEVLGQEFIGGSNFATSLYGMHYWDLLLNCALFDDVDVWVDQNLLYYASPSLIARTTVPLLWGRDFLINEGLTGTHAVMFNKNIKIIVHSYTPRTRQATTTHFQSDGAGGYIVQSTSRTATSSFVPGTNEVTTTIVDSNGNLRVTKGFVSGGSYTGTTSIANDSGVEREVFWLSNVSPDKINTFAKAQWRQSSQLEFGLVGAIDVTPELLDKFSRTSLLAITGAPYARFNSPPSYYPREVRWNFSVDGGFTVTPNGVNHLLPMAAV